LMISHDDSRNLYEAKDRYIKMPDFEFWPIQKPEEAKLVEDGFEYCSETNKQWLSVPQMRALLTREGLL